MNATRWAALGVAALAALIDFRTRRIPNFLTLGASVGGIAFHAWTSGASGGLLGASGWLVGVGLFLPLYLVRGMGGGDVKLLGAVGALLGPVGVLWAALFTTLAGGILGLVVGLARGYATTAFKNMWFLLGMWKAGGIRPVPGLTIADTLGPRLPYGVAIAAGTLAAVWFK